MKRRQNLNVLLHALSSGFISKETMVSKIPLPFPKVRRQGGIALLVLVVVAAFLFVPPAQAAEPTGAQMLQVERQLGCPICTNLPLDVCDNSICRQMRGVIHDKLAAGDSPDQVVHYFVSRFGEGILLNPPAQGFNLAAWYVPLLALIVGGAIVWGFLRQSIHQHRPVEQAKPDPSLDAYRQRVRQDLGASK